MKSLSGIFIFVEGLSAKCLDLKSVRSHAFAHKLKRYLTIRQIYLSSHPKKIYKTKYKNIFI